MAATGLHPGDRVAFTHQSRSDDDVESMNQAFPRPESPISRSTRGYCTNCGSNIGEFYNSWHKITGSYYVPALLGSYRSQLKSTDKKKAAFSGTNLEGCSIIPSSCPSPSCTDPPIGFTVVDAPAGKEHFIDLDFFKLSRIELRCETPAGKIITVNPREEPPTGLLAVRELEESSPVQHRESATSAETMEVDSRPPIPSQQMNHLHHAYHDHSLDRSYQHQMVPHPEVNRPALPPASSLRSPTGPASVSSVLNRVSLPPPIQTSHEAPQRTQASPINPAAQHLSPVAPHLRSVGQQSPVAHAYPRAVGEVTIDAIERLQTQISQNSGALAAQTRDIRQGEESLRQLDAGLRREFAAQVHRQTLDIQRIDEAVARMQLEMHGMHQAIESLGRELAIAGAERQRTAMPLSQTISGQDSALELMAQQIAMISHKANEVDTIKIAIEILKNKVQRLEEGSVPVQTAVKPRHSPPQQVRSSMHPHSSQQPLAPPESVLSTPAQAPATLRTQPSGETSSSTATPEVSHRPEPVRSSSGFTAINSGIKRPNPNDVEASNSFSADVPGSPKRQKVVGLDPSTPVPVHHHEIVEVAGYLGSVNKITPTLPSQHNLSHAISASQPLPYDPYGTQEGLPADPWRNETHRVIEHRPRGRPRGSGTGSRGGRGRKSTPARIQQIDALEWDDHGFATVPSSQGSPEDYYSQAARTPRGIARRGSGGGTGRGGYAASERAVSLGLQGVSAGIGVSGVNDPYSHTKKTRSKPVRNADGILIRKDGRPDMRSQSSAANLRKVHARKEEEQSGQSPTPLTPTTLRHSISASVAETPSPTTQNQLDNEHNVSASVQKKHNSIMGKMFPDGVDSSRKQHDYARQVFEEDHDHTAQPRTRRHSLSKAQNVAKAKAHETIEGGTTSRPISASGADGTANSEAAEPEHVDGEVQEEA